jgi:hypothetical protein
MLMNLASMMLPYLGSGRISREPMTLLLDMDLLITCSFCDCAAHLQGAAALYSNISLSAYLLYNQ